jgi:Ca-activated chloride channel homolog
LTWRKVTVTHGFRRFALSLPAVYALSLAGPERIDAQESTFKSGVDMVPLTVTVTDAAGNYTTGLSETDFLVFEDGVKQTLSYFATDHVPVDVAFVIDTSASMQSDLPLFKQAAHGLVRLLSQGDRGAVVDVKSSVRAPQPLTDDRTRLEAAIDALRASGSTAMYDGVYTALREFEREGRRHPDVRRQTLVLLSDGLDNASHLTLETTTDLARRLNVSIYTIALRGSAGLAPVSQQNREFREAAYAMRALATEAGGRVFFPRAANELPAIYSAIGHELASQYQVGYVPTRPIGDGGFRHVSVRVLSRTNAIARTRSGYFAVWTSAPTGGSPSPPSQP